ncbi:MAG TPA: Lrp/AsnC ligand binding domain-containing protein [Nitrososphaeraceae archaeon]|nr:Lrp/AsnC ligand binding domain-containing protein [Nitrososphaeraceae archaeon]
MPKAYVLINCESGYEALVAKSIKSIDNVLTCNIVYGVYDIIVEIIFDTLKQLEYIIQKRIRNISKIQSTMTLIPFEFKLK